MMNVPSGAYLHITYLAFRASEQRVCVCENLYRQRRHIVKRSQKRDSGRERESHSEYASKIRRGGELS